MASEVNERLCQAAEDGDVAGIAAALLAGGDPNAFEGSWTPLQWAAIHGHVAAIAALLAAGARVDDASRLGTTPLMRAAYQGHTAAVAALLAAGADVNHADTNSETALHSASMLGRLDAARALVEAGARTDVRNKEGGRPIDVVRAPACNLDLAAPLHLAASPTRRHAQVCKYVSDKSAVPALRAVLASAEPWSRRRPIAIACYGVEWEWEA
jgi:ankyrin repeat protein